MTILTANQALDDLKQLADSKKAKLLQGFFKTGPGEYGEGDKFLGIMVPQTRKLARQYCDLPLGGIQKLLKSPFHEARLLALFILVQRFQKSNEAEQKTIYDFYFKFVRYINNWDFVDLSSPQIVGAYLWRRDKQILFKLVKSRNLWERRIAVLATFYFIKQNEFSDSFKIATILLNDEHDLIHKATGWMLREIYKRDSAVAEAFLKKHYLKMPRTMLRYAIERFPESRRQAFLKSRIP